MKIIKMISLLDGSKHASKEIAQRHLGNILSSGKDLTFMEGLANKNVLHIREYLIENRMQIHKTLQILDELAEVEQLNGF